MSKRVWVVPGYVLDRPVDDASDDVWAARIAGSIDQVALRIIPLHGEDAIEAGRRAALALTELTHPYLLALHEVITLRDAVVVTSDLMSGGSLDGMLRQRGRLMPHEVAALLGPVASALAYVHERGIVHGDVAPRRVLVSIAGMPVLSGLGVARIGGADAPNTSTPAYIDPTVACGVFPSPTSDVFMLGAVAFHALTGAPLWSGSSQEATIAAIAAPLDRSLDHVSERLARAGITGDLAAMVTAALALDAHARPTAAQLASGFGSIQPYVPPPPPPAAVPSSTLTPQPTAPPPLPTVAPPIRPAIEPDLVGWAYEPETPPPSLMQPAPPPIAEVVPRIESPVTELTLPPAAEPAVQPAVEPVETRAEHVARSARHVPPKPARPPKRPTKRATKRPTTRRPTRRRSPWLIVAIIAAVVGASATVWAVTAGSGSSHKPSAGRTPKANPTGSLPNGSGLPFDPASGNVSPTALPTGYVVVDAADAAQILTVIDSIRQRAFASRAPILLTGVYVDGKLLSDDQALLRYLVPEGCGLQGVRTTYAGVQVLDQSAVSLVVLAQVSVASAILVCKGKVSGQSFASPAIKDRITLIKRGTGWVISDITQVSAPTSPTS